MTRKPAERVRKTATAITTVTATEGGTEGVPPMADEGGGAGLAPPAPVLILHLRVRTKDLEDEGFSLNMMQDQLLVYRPTWQEPEAYDPNPFAMAEEVLATDETISTTAATPASSSEPAGRSSVTSSCTNTSDLWNGRPSHTMAHESTSYNTRGVCWWCCHGFEGDAVSIPLEGSVGYGTFCSFPCASAYLFGQEEMSFRRWERFSLLCSEYRKTGGKYQRVPQAPPRQTLRMFGGSLDIEEFRNLTHRECMYRVVTPTLLHVQPTISVVPLHQIHASMVREAGCGSGGESRTGVGEEPLAAGPLRLKRSKPILEGKNTLENYIVGTKSQRKV